MQRTNTKAIEKMDVNKGRPLARPASGKKVVEFVGDVKQELKKVEWTSPEELRAYTKIVVASMFVFGMFIYFVDLLIQGVLGGFHLLVRALVG